MYIYCTEKKINILHSLEKMNFEKKKKIAIKIYFFPQHIKIIKENTCWHNSLFPFLNKVSSFNKMDNKKCRNKLNNIS